MYENTRCRSCSKIFKIYYIIKPLSQYDINTEIMNSLKNTIITIINALTEGNNVASTSC